MGWAGQAHCLFGLARKNPHPWPEPLPGLHASHLPCLPIPSHWHGLPPPTPERPLWGAPSLQTPDPSSGAPASSPPAPGRSASFWNKDAVKGRENRRPTPEGRTECPRQTGGSLGQGLCVPAEPEPPPGKALPPALIPQDFLTCQPEMKRVTRTASGRGHLPHLAPPV